jgi:DNA (cytosine-5)-methyltransferase 1
MQNKVLISNELTRVECLYPETLYTPKNECITQNRKRLKVIEFFSGIGSYHQALKELDIPHDIVGISEINNDALRAYQLLHGKVPLLGDIRKIKELPLADLWCYSFPCTDISIAGSLKGMEKDSNTSSSLLWEIERLLLSQTVLPSYLIMENVPMLISKRYKSEFDKWLEFLSSLGYHNYYQVLNAKDYGVAQNRKRLYLVSSLEDINYEFPSPIPLDKKLSDYLDSVVDDKYFISEQMLKYYTDMKNRNGYIRGARFTPHDDTSEYAFTITTRGGSTSTDNFIVIPEATIKGYKEAYLGDAVYINRPHQKRGVVQRQSIQTIKTGNNDIGVVVKKDELICIRKITPRESFRLMGWSDYDFNRLGNNI